MQYHATRQAANIAALILAGIVYVATGHQFNGALNRPGFD
jgi:hypothetical protein